MTTAPTTTTETETTGRPRVTVRVGDEVLPLGDPRAQAELRPLARRIARDWHRANHVLTRLDPRQRERALSMTARQIIATDWGRPRGREARPAMNGRHRGSRRVTRAPPSNDDDDDSDPERLCAVCGCSIEQRRPQSTTCGDACRQLKRREAPGPSECASCGERLPDGRSHRSYCDDTCAQVAEQPTWRPARLCTCGGFALHDEDGDARCIACGHATGSRIGRVNGFDLHDALMRANGNRGPRRGRLIEVAS